jgi:DNA-binding transcriptional regulator YhcF (GntR family)
MTSKKSNTRDHPTVEMSSTPSKKSNTRGTLPKQTWEKSTVQERQDISQFLRQRMNAGGSLPYGTINEAAKHFGRNRHMIGEIYKELKPKSAHERKGVITEQERQDIAQFLRQRMNAGRTLPPGTINEAAQHFGRHWSTIKRIYKELEPNSLKQRAITDQERQDIVLFLRQRMNAGGTLPYGTINEAAQHFARHRRTIGDIYKELEPKSVNKKRKGVITEQERQDIVLFLRHRMNLEGSLPYGSINEAARHFGRQWKTIREIYKVLKPNKPMNVVNIDVK